MSATREMKSVSADQSRKRPLADDSGMPASKRSHLSVDGVEGSAELQRLLFALDVDSAESAAGAFDVSQLPITLVVDLVVQSMNVIGDDYVNTKMQVVASLIHKRSV